MRKKRPPRSLSGVCYILIGEKDNITNGVKILYEGRVAS